MKKLKGSYQGSSLVQIQCDTIDEMLCLPNEVSVLNPLCVRSNGLRNTRLQGHFDKHKANTSKGASSSSE